MNLKELAQAGARLLFAGKVTPGPATHRGGDRAGRRRLWRRQFGYGAFKYRDRVNGWRKATGLPLRRSLKRSLF